MTVGNSILILRQKLQDIRHKDTGEIISNCEDDGVRWTASQLLVFINTAILKISRFTRLYPDKNASSLGIALPKMGEGVNIAIEDISNPDGEEAEVNIGEHYYGWYCKIPDHVMNITGFDVPEFDFEWDEVTLEKLGNAMHTEQLWDEGNSYYTVAYDETLGRIILFNSGFFPETIPAEGDGEPTAWSPTRVIFNYIINAGNYTFSDKDKTIYLIGVDDLLIDLAEREAREIELNTERVLIITDRLRNEYGIAIQSKVGQE